jgi:molybdopterin/thiamine biosynthesis adenylyltransferase
MTPDQVNRYARHLVLKEIGGPGQRALLGANIAIVGAGGLGGPAGFYLAAAGIGQITLIDDDVVDLSNLQRQVQFNGSHIGHQKTAAMGAALCNMNPDIFVHQKVTRLKTDNAADLLAGHDLVLDGTDSFETRFLINRTCLDLRIPLVSGALGRFDGQVSAFASNKDGPCYQCLVPDIPPNAETCEQVGVVGALAGIIGSMMALETIKIVTGAGRPLIGKVWIYDGLRGEGRTVNLSRDPACKACG